MPSLSYTLYTGQILCLSSGEEEQGAQPPEFYYILTNSVYVTHTQYFLHFDKICLLHFTSQFLPLSFMHSPAVEAKTVEVSAA